MTDAKQQLDEAQSKANRTGDPVTVYADGQPVVTVRPEEMKWLCNTYWPKRPGRFVITWLGNPRELPHAVENTWLADKIIGEPQATDWHTVEELKAMGMVGVYEAEVVA